MPSFPARLALLVPGLLLAASGVLQAQSAQPAVSSDDDVWNTPRALELIERARARRAVPRADSGLSNYRARASGHIYFFLDRSDSEERTLVRVDQVALEIFWAAPNRTKQRIVGLRHANKLPNRMHYHLDHLTVVQDEFGDLIRLGDGDEVSDVVHPAARNSGDFYDFRLADSLSIRLAGAADPIRVYELEVRPRRPDRPGFVGSIFLDQASAAIVRMNFTFTPASYVDKRLDYIRVGLDNGLWDGRHWLPNEQTLEIRRQVPIFDFPTGGVIRGVVRINGYEFNQPLPPAIFFGSRVVAVPKQQREAYDFPIGLFDRLEEEGLTGTTDLDQLRGQAMSLIRERYLSGLPRLRFYLPNSSAALRYNRAESLFLGGGLSYRTGEASQLRMTAGYAFGPGHPTLMGEWRASVGEATDLSLKAERNALRDIGPRPGVPGALNTLGALFLGSDFLDPYYGSGASARIERRFAGDWSSSIELAYEDQRAARQEVFFAPLNRAAEFGPVRRVAEGTELRTTFGLGYGTAAASPRHGSLRLDAARFAGAGYLRTILELGAQWRSADLRSGAAITGTTGFITGSPPPQRLFLLGGPGTIPGYAHRGFAGDRFALLGVEAHRELLAPWLSVRAIGAAGWSGSTTPFPADWLVTTTEGIRASLGAGIGIFYDILRIDLARGLRGGGWQWVISVSPGLADIL